eukprot:4760059-Amphidinium_carterae.1
MAHQTRLLLRHWACVGVSWVVLKQAFVASVCNCPRFALQQCSMRIKMPGSVPLSDESCPKTRFALEGSCRSNTSTWTVRAKQQTQRGKD